MDPESDAEAGGEGENMKRTIWVKGKEGWEEITCYSIDEKYCVC